MVGKVGWHVFDYPFASVQLEIIIKFSPEEVSNKYIR